MLDVGGAAQTITLLSTNVNLTSMGVVPMNSAVISTQNMMSHGAFALIAPFIQLYWPTKEEVSTYVTQEILKAFLSHDTKVFHSQALYSMAQTTQLEPGTGPKTVPKTTTLMKKGRPIPLPMSLNNLSDEIDIGSYEIDGVTTTMETILAWAADVSVPYLTT